MVDILVRNVNDETARRLKEKAAEKGASLSETAREALTAFVQPDRNVLIRQARKLRAMSPASNVDSTTLIREDRDRR
ncbi:MAG: FitA-like ribbon-helix-helix domain-containing protein [Bradyrhizobium sp.]